MTDLLKATCTVASPVTGARQRGFNLVEVLVSLAVLTIGLTGVAALLIQGMSASNSATLNSVAVTHAQTGVEIMRSNLEAYTAGYFAGDNTTDDEYTTADCSSGCSAEAQADADYASWRTQLAVSMPDGRGYICTDSTPDDGQPGAVACDDEGQNVIKIFWRDIKDQDAEAASDDVVYQRYVTTVLP